VTLNENKKQKVMMWCAMCVRFARVSGLHIKQVARSLHLRFTAFTGDAMGMNMVSKVTVVNLLMSL